MIALSIALVIISGMALWFFNKKLELNKPIAPIPLNDKVQEDIVALYQKVNALEITLGMTRR